MKKHFIYGLIIIAGVLYSVSCQKSEPIAPESEQQETTPEVTPEDAKPSGPVYITATIPDDDISSKVSFEKDGTKWKRTWEKGDQVSVNGTIFTVQSVAENGTATLYSETAPDEADSYTITYGSFSNSQTRSADGDATGLSVFSLSGVNEYTTIEFSSDWASKHDGTYSESGVLYLRAKMPDGIAATVKQVKITAVDSEGNPNNLFGEDNEVTVTFEKPGDKEGNGILDIFVNLYSPTAQNVEGTSFLVRFSTEADTDNADFRYTRYYTFASDIALKPGKVNRLSLNCAETAISAGKDDDGTEAHPYIVADKYQLNKMHDVLADNETVYIKQVADIDLDGIAWVPFNIGETEPAFAKGIAYDGGNYTISHLTSGNVKYASFAGVLKGSVSNVTFDAAKITGTSKAGVVAGYIGSSSTGAEGHCENVIVKNAELTGTSQGLGAFAGQIEKSDDNIKNCHVNTASVISKADRAGGFAGQVANGINVSGCSANNVTVEGTINIGGFVGVGYGNFTTCTSSGTVDSINDVSDQDIALGGFVGYFQNGEISKCSSSVSIEHTTRGRDIGGFVGKMLVGTIEKSFATGKASGTQRNVGGFAGLITNTTSSSVIRDCYCTGDVVANSYNGGFAGLVEKGTVVIANSYSISDVEAVAFAAGGFVGVQTSATCTIENCAAWNSSVTAGSIGSGNWSSGAVIGVCFPKCTVTNTFRNPEMSLTAYWVPVADYDHPNVSSAHPLVKQNGDETAAISTSKGQDGYPIFPYHGHVAVGQTLSLLASTTLGWSSDVWDFNGELPTLKKE